MSPRNFAPIKRGRSISLPCSAAVKRTIIYFNPELRGLWPSPLAAQWASQYPQLFDRDDLRITRLQPKNHFAEWFSAIYLFHTHGVLSLVEKYVYSTHPRKRAVLDELFTESQRKVLADIRTQLGVQLPDLLVFSRDRSRFWFAEVKGPGDRLREVQWRSHAEIVRRLGVPVELITVTLTETASPDRLTRKIPRPSVRSS
jgi:VRR-NUC domain